MASLVKCPMSCVLQKHRLNDRATGSTEIVLISQRHHQHQVFLLLSFWLYLSKQHCTLGPRPTFSVRQAPAKQLDGLAPALLGGQHQPVHGRAVVELLVPVAGQLQVVLPHLRVRRREAAPGSGLHEKRGSYHILAPDLLPKAQQPWASGTLSLPMLPDKPPPLIPSVTQAKKKGDRNGVPRACAVGWACGTLRGLAPHETVRRVCTPSIEETTVGEGGQRGQAESKAGVMEAVVPEPG